jgi:hypothetical protein
VLRSPPTSTASSTRSGVSAKNEALGSVVIASECILFAALTVPNEADCMPRMGVYEQIKAAIQDLLAPELQAIRGDLRRLERKIDDVDARVTIKIDSVQAQLGSMKNELVSEIRRVDVRIDGMERELRTAIDIRERLAALEARRA